MAYNPAMYPNYGGMYGNAYGAGYGQPYQPAGQSYSQGGQSPAQGVMGILWVDGEVGAKAFQMPAGWSPNTPVPLWDTNDTIIYLKSVNQMGMPNPLQKIVYRMEETNPKQAGQNALLMSGDAAQDGHGADMSQYVRKDEADGFVRKDDLERMKTELMESIQGISAAGGPAGTQGAAQGTARRNTKGE